MDRIVSFVDMPKTWLSLAEAEIPATFQGTVFLGRDEALDRKVAVKTLRHDRSDEESRARLTREAQLLSHLKHPHICRIHDLIELAAMQDLGPGIIAADLMTPADSVLASDRLADVFDLFEHSDLDELPVLDENGTPPPCNQESLQLSVYTSPTL